MNENSSNRHNDRQATRRPAATAPSLSTRRLAGQNARFAGTAGVSHNNRDCAFLPAFLDTGTGTVYLSRFDEERLAPVHLLDSLPQELVVSREPGGRVTAVKASVTAGFVRQGRFFTRSQAAGHLQRQLT